MNLLLIGLDDSKAFSNCLDVVAKINVSYFLADDLAMAEQVIQRKQIDFFVCDLKFSQSEIELFLQHLAQMHKTTAGALIRAKESDEILLRGSYSYFIKDYILRPYDAARIAVFWHRLRAQIYR